MKHLVNSLKFDLHCPLEEQAFELRQEVMQQLQPLLIEGIEGSCAAHMQNDEWIRIDKLEIDLGRINPAELKEQFGPLFRQQFETKLMEYLSRITSPEGNTGIQDPELQLFFHFMQTGRLPWWADTEPDFEALCQRIIQRSPEAVTTFFFQKAKAKYIWQRVVRQLDHRFWAFLLDSMEPFEEAHIQLESLIPILKAHLQQSGDPLAATVLDELQKLEQDHRILLLDHGSVIFEAEKQHSIKNVIVGLILQQLFPADEQEHVALHAQLRKVLAGQESSGKTKAVPDVEIVEEQKMDPDAVASDKMIVHDAGLVLLGPYLKPFFTALGLWQDKQWASAEAQERAACLLRWMATGKEVDKEYNLVLEKLLCGIPLHHPIYTGFEFTENERKEAETLLESVITHWQSLKNTSVEGFRSSFLLREAVLYRKEGDWQMVVEKKTLDVLLESIPWGYGTLCLSWNEYLIFTEW